MKKIPRKIKEMIAVLFFSYIIVMSVVEYVNTNDKGYLILPGILAAVILWELSARFYGADQRKPRK